MGDELDRHLFHAPLEPALRNEALAETGLREVAGEAEADTTGDHHRVCPLSQRQVAGDGAKAEAQPIQRRGGEAVAAGKRSRPQLLVVVEGEVLSLDGAQCLVEVPQTLAGRDTLDRDATEVASQLRQDLVLEQVERGEVDMPALGLDHFIMVRLAKQRGDTKAGAGPHDRGHANRRRRNVGPAQMQEMLLRERRNRIGDRPEVVDDDIAVDAEPLLDQRRTDNPRIVGELQHLAADRAGKGNRQLVG